MYARGDEIDSSDLGFTLVTECVIGPRTAEVEANWPQMGFASIAREERISEAAKQLEHANNIRGQVLREDVYAQFSPAVGKIKEPVEVFKFCF